MGRFQRYGWGILGQHVGVDSDSLCHYTDYTFLIGLCEFLHMSQWLFALPLYDQHTSTYKYVFRISVSDFRSIPK